MIMACKQSVVVKEYSNEYSRYIVHGCIRTISSDGPAALVSPFVILTDEPEIDLKKYHDSFERIDDISIDLFIYFIYDKTDKKVIIDYENISRYIPKEIA